MTRKIILIPVENNCGLSSVVLGLIRSLEQQRLRVVFFQLTEPARSSNQTTLALLRQHPNVTLIEPIAHEVIFEAFAHDQLESFNELVLQRVNEALTTSAADVLIIEGCLPEHALPFANQVNHAMMGLLDSEIVLVTHPGQDRSEELKRRVELIAAEYARHQHHIAGVIINKVGSPVNRDKSQADLNDVVSHSQHEQNSNQLEILRVFSRLPFRLLGCIPWSIDLLSPRVSDLQTYLDAKIYYAGEMHTRRVKSITFCARSMHNMIAFFKPGTLLVTAHDRADVIIAASLAAMNGIKMAGLLLTSEGEPSQPIMDLCQRAFETGFPVFGVNSNTWDTARGLTRFNLNVPNDDVERIEGIKEHVAAYLDRTWIKSLQVKSPLSALPLNSAAFKYNLLEQAKKDKKRIILPEGYDLRTIEAACICSEKSVVTPVLLGNPEEIARLAKQQDLVLPSQLEIIPTDTVSEHHIARLLELRKHKGMTEIVAKTQLQNPIVLATLMLEMGEVDGLVSGAVHTTADTIRPALQLIKTAPGNSLVSSVFFMLLPDQVLIYGDCAINPDPNAEQLAEIALQSAASAKRFGLLPKVAMISYSTGESGTGADVDKVRLATEIAQRQQPDLMIDGPLQYDAAITEQVARSKAPNSPVAGHANVFIFPDLNTGNTTYKAVQRSANLISIGPMLQGLNKPVNDLSRGASVKDIVYTIALTAIQAQGQPS